MAARPLAKPPFWPLAMLALVLALQATLVIGRAVNWDEFYHYSQVHKLAAGTLVQPLQTLYTRAFLWVTALPGSGIDHIVTIRWFMLGCEIATILAIAGIAGRFASRQAAWLCALAYAGAGYVFQHATSFRFDAPAAALLMGAAWIALRSRLGPGAIIASGLLIGTAAMLTIKAVLYAPVFAGIAWLRWQESGRAPATLARLAGIALASAAAFAAIYWLHAASLAGNVDDEARAILGRAGGKMFSLGIQPYWPHHLKGAAIAPVVTAMLLAFPFVLRRAERPLAEKLALIGLVAPLATLLFYHNTAPYYFVFMLAPVCAGLAPVMDRALQRYSEALIAMVLAALAGAVWMMEQPGPQDRQRQLLAQAERLFPDHPAYFDSCAMLGNFPKANAFMTPMGIALYRQGSYPAMADTLERRAVPLVLAADPLFERVMGGNQPVPELLEQDLAALRGNYVRYWGPFWVAGREIASAGDFTLLVPGSYRIEGAELLIDGKLHPAGSVIELDRGPHRAEPRGGKARVIWAKARPAPAEPAPASPWFTDF